MRAGRTAAALLVLLVVAQPLLVWAPPAAAGDGHRSGDLLEVTDSYVVATREEWDTVLVREDATLRIVSGGMLVTGTLRLDLGCDLHIVGGTLAVFSEDLYDHVSILGSPREVLVTGGGVLMVEGSPGDLPRTWGRSSYCNLGVGEGVSIVDSQLLFIGGEGLSPDAPLSSGDLEDHSMGGFAYLNIQVDPMGSGISVVRSSIRVVGGDGGNAPDGRAPVGDRGGEAGGFSAGGNVSGSVGKGGYAALNLEGPKVTLDSSTVEVFAGDGGNAGDGGDAGTTAGGGGGGYSGGAGAGSQGPATPGGTVSDGVGSGGDARAVVSSGEYIQLASTVLVAGGDGGDAGDGGDCDVTSPSTALGGGGGGGYSGGGGGGASGDTHGTNGSWGGALRGRVGSGGGAEFVVEASDATLSGGLVEVTAGSGGRGGAAGTSTRDENGWRAGGGGGAYSAGGGAGTLSSPWSSGAGGDARTPSHLVASGGDARLVVDVEEATIPVNVTLTSTPGEGGDCWRADADGVAGGEGAGLITRSGYRRDLVPRARVSLLSPEDGAVSSRVPTFRWALAHPSTVSGEVMTYQVQMDDDVDFTSPEMNFQIYSDFVYPAWVPNFTSYWRVRALYERPEEAPGPWSPARSFTYINLPPTINGTPVFDVLVSQVTVIDLSPYVSDPDDVVGRLSVECDEDHVLSTTRLNITVHFPVEVGKVPLNFTVTDSLNRVEGQLILNVIRYRHAPIISGLTNHKPPLELKLYEGTEAWYDVKVHDVDSDRFTYWTTGSWEGVTAFPNGTLRVSGERGQVGDHEFTLRVADEGGLEDSMRVYVEVLNVNDPPEPPSIVSPGQRITVREGDMVSISAVVSDPDLRYGQVLNVTFISNDTGVLREVRTTTLATVDYDLFTVGEHVVTVVVSDGQYSSSDQVVVLVEDTPPGTPVTSPGGEGPSMWVYIVASLVLFAVGFTVGHLQRRGRRGPEGEG